MCDIKGFLVGSRVWGVGRGGGGLGCGAWGMGPNPKPPIPNPQSPIPIFKVKSEIYNANIIFNIKNKNKFYDKL